jgi:flagellin
MAQVDFSRIASNIGALNALNSLRDVNNKLSLHQTRLASGKRINRVADDPAGLTIANKLNACSKGMKTALGNIGDAKNLLSVAESGLSKISGILTKMRNLAQSGVSDTLDTDERKAIRTQLQEYETQINDTIGQTTWNGEELISTGGSKTFVFQTGVDSGDTTNFTGLDLFDSSNGLSLNATTGLTTTSGGTSTEYKTYMSNVDTAIDTIFSKMSNVGALMSKLTFKEEQLVVSQVNIESAYNRIINADMAQEQLEATKYSILQQTSITMLAQANTAPQGILSLFR